MASSLILLLDDISSVLHDVALLTKVAAEKTTGVVSDDMALNARQVVGVRADRELPIILAMAKGSLLNKAILVPLALLLSAFAPWAVLPLMVMGGICLSYEGGEKLVHYVYPSKEDIEQANALHVALLGPKTDMVAFECDKIQGAEMITSMRVKGHFVFMVSNCTMVGLHVLSGLWLLLVLDTLYAHLNIRGIRSWGKSRPHELPSWYRRAFGIQVGNAIATRS